ncbi:Metallo-dependent phosphatase [Neolentinus lepideus HHB14362 ss-1]|uniref:Metallo-dependent phosphatase n=1 Tax=Neolentinus lepideus HHB14362 ss-1 TaxID=1314782 RepID=A0A165VJI1_9AGAM|nr:Metallo-dependent phosphatase [Neolentinus lepideus HHB14362 ss-1]
MPRIFSVGLLSLLPIFLAVYLAWCQPEQLQEQLRGLQHAFWDKTPSANSANPAHDIEKPMPFVRRIIAVGDLHGDIGNAQKVLQMAKVVDENGDWSGNVDFFVQTGDIIDRGDDTIKLFAWMDKLRQQAPAKGGQVLSHLGNHEWMNAIGDWRYVWPTEIDTFGGSDKRQEVIMTGWIGKTWAANYTTTSRLPLHPSLGPPNTDYPPASPRANAPSPISHAAISFVHGGLAPTYPHLTPFPSHINRISSSLLSKLQNRRPFPPPHPPHPYPGLPRDATPEEERLYGTDGPLWYRGWALDPEESSCRQVDDVLNRTGTRRMIMGHTPDFDKIVSRCNGKILIIDTGISHAYGGVLSALSIVYTLTPVDSAANTKTWVEKEVITALYMDGHEVLAEDTRAIVGNIDIA